MEKRGERKEGVPVLALAKCLLASYVLTLLLLCLLALLLYKLHLTEGMVTISRAEYEQLQQENAQLEAKSAKLEEAHTRLEAKLAAREQEQAQVITSLTLQNEWLLGQLKLSRQTMANWLLKASEKWMQPVYDVLHEQLCREPVLHADETTLQVLKEPGRSSTSKSYMWLYRTSGCAKQVIVLYEY